MIPVVGNVRLYLAHLDRRVEIGLARQPSISWMMFYADLPRRYHSAAPILDLSGQQCFFSKPQRTRPQCHIKATDFFKHASADRHVRPHQAFWASAIDRLGRSQPGSVQLRRPGPIQISCQLNFTHHRIRLPLDNTVDHSGDPIVW